MEIRVKLGTYYGEKLGKTALIRRMIPLVETKPLTLVFNIEVSKLSEDAKEISVKPKLVHGKVGGGSYLFGPTDFDIVGVLSSELKYCKMRYTYAAVPSVSGDCEVRLSFRSLNDDDKVVDDFGVNNTSRDEEGNRFYRRTIRIYSFYEIMVFFFAAITTLFAVISTVAALLSTYFAWRVSSNSIQLK